MKTFVQNVILLKIMMYICAEYVYGDKDIGDSLHGVVENKISTSTTPELQKVFNLPQGI
jgi:hypothetical protein